MTRKFTTRALLLAAASIALGGVAIAQTAPTAAPAAQGAQARPDRPDRNAPETRAQAQQRAEAMFARMDSNNDGTLNQADRDARRAQRSEAAFTRMDANRDGNISRAEWDAAQQARQTRMNERRQQRGQQAGEAGGERRGHGMRGMRGGRGGHHMGGMMMRGGDRNATVTREQFVANALARFDRMDANRDGTVTPEERQAARQAMRQQRGERGQGGHRAVPAPAPAPGTN